MSSSSSARTTPRCAPTAGGCIFRDEGVCPVCGDKCKRRSLPAGRPARLRRRRLVRPLRGAGLRPRLRPRPAWPSTSPSSSSRSSRSRPWPTLLLRFPDPYDFELSTERFRVFGPDLANLWHDGALLPRRRRPRGAHRGSAGRRRRRAAAMPRRRPSSRSCSGRSSTSPRSTRGRRTIRCSGRSRVRFAGLRPPLAPDPFESLVTSITAQQVSLRSAFAMRSRMIERFGERAGARVGVPDARANRPGDGGRAVCRRLLAPQGRVRARPGAERPRPRRAGRARRRRDPRAHHGGARTGRLDGGVVPGAASRAPARVAGRRPRAPQGGHAALRCRCARARPAPRPVPEPVGPLPAGGGAARGRQDDDPARDRGRRGRCSSELWSEFEADVPFPFVEERETLGRGVARHARRHSRRRRVPRRGRRGPGRVWRASRPPSKGRAHIQMVHVRPRARRQGVATALSANACRTRATAARRGSALT